MTQDELYTLKQRILASFDKALIEGDWESRTLFRAIGKRLREFRDQIENEILPEAGENTGSLKLQQENKHLKTIYISLYQTEYRDLQRWMHCIKALTEYCITRPIYLEETAIKQALRAKTDNVREAYVIAKIKPEHIIEEINGQKMQDKWGNYLVRLKENSLKPEHIEFFIHDNKHYSVVEGNLVLVEQTVD